jgi:hypothetical protein
MNLGMGMGMNQCVPGPGMGMHPLGNRVHAQHAARPSLRENASERPGMDPEFRKPGGAPKRLRTFKIVFALRTPATWAANSIIHPIDFKTFTSRLAGRFYPGFTTSAARLTLSSSFR